MAMDAVFQEEKKALAKTEQIIEYAATELEKQIAKQNYSIENFVCVDYSDRQELAELRAETRRKQERADELRGYQESPYFGRMDLDVVGEDDTEVVYIGKTGIVIDHEFLVSDWRSPLGQYFYMKSERKFHAGQVDYILQLRRALDIKGGNLISYRTEFDGETVSLEGDVIDPFLLTVLKDKRRQNRLTDIIKTIQSNQNDIIRRPRSESFIVQGCAGSGKTMILLHRLSYLLFNYREISPDSIKVITPNSLFDAHINELSNELGLDRIERKSVEEFYVALIKGFSRKMDVSSEVSSEKGMSIDLLRYLYSEEYYRATCAHYDSYWSEILSKIEDLNLSGIASRLRIDFDIPSDHDYAAYSRLESSLRLLSSSISEEIAQRNRLVSQIEYFRDEKVKATDENERCARNLAEIAKSTSAFLENSISAQTAQLGNFSTAANDQEKRIAAWNQELRELEEARKKKREQLTAIQNEIINLTNYRTVSMRTDAFAVGLLSVLSKQVDEIKQFESDIQKTAVYNFGKRNRLRAQLADAIENFSKLAMTQVSSYLDAGVTEIKKADQRIEELRQIVENESRQYENGKTILANLRREIRVLSLCRGLFADSTYPDLRGLDRNTHNNMPHEMRRYEEAFKQVTNAKRRLETTVETLTDLEAQFEDIIKMNLSEADVDAVNVAASLVAKLRLSEISRSIMMKDMLDAYRAHGEVYKRTNYRHKLYIKLLFCYLYYRKITGNYGSFINIDEAQDISVCEYRLIRLVLGNRCVFNLYGDVNQLVYEYKGISDWDDISSEISGTVFTLNENYRNTLQITNFCNKEFGAEVYPIGVSGKDVREQSLSEAISWILDEKRTTPELRAAIIFRYGHIGISDALHQMTEGRDVSWYEIDEDKVSILSVESAKGLEFDIIVAVVDGMTFNEKYISYTRALENLVVVRDHFEYTKAADPIIDEVTLDDEVLADESNDSEIRITVSPVEVSVSQSNPIVNETEQTVIPQIALKNSDTELISAISGIIKEAFGDDQELSDEQCQIVHLLGRKTKLACTAPAGWKKSIILFALAKYAHENYGMQSILTAEGHLQENELVLAEKLGLKAGSISENMTGFLTDFKKEKYDIVFVPYDFFAYEANINEFVQYFSGKVSYWGIDHPSEEVILWTQIKKTIEALIATPFLMSKNGFDGVDLSGFEIANIIDDSEPIKDLVHTVSFADIEDKKTWVGEHAAAELWGQGIVYCDTEEQCKEISKLLRKRKIKAEAYTNVSDPNNAERINYLSNSFSKGGLPVLVTTHDAGKNLSNPNIRFIMHYSVPKDADLYTLHISQIGKLSEEPIVYDLRP